MEIDFSAQIKEKNLSLSPKKVKLGEFELSERAKTFLEAKASTFNEASTKETSAEILASVMQNGFEAAKNFLRPGVSDLQIAIARLNRFLKYGDAKLLTVEPIDILDVEYSLASVNAAQNKLTENDFKASIEIEIEDENEDTCDCENPEMEDGESESKVCSKCKKPAKAKKKC
jgi:hypothetical protein